MTLDIYTDFWSANSDKIYNLISPCCSDFRVFYRFKILLDSFILDGLFFLFSEIRSFIPFLFFSKTGSPGWPPILCIAKAGLEPLVFLPPLSESWDFRHVPPKTWLFFFFPLCPFLFGRQSLTVLLRLAWSLCLPCLSLLNDILLCAEAGVSLSPENTECKVASVDLGCLRGAAPQASPCTSFCFPVRWKELGALL